MITSYLFNHSPEFIKARIKDERGFKKVVGNINWLMLEKLVLTGLTFFVGIIVVRYLGPQKFGQYSYAQSFISILMPIATLGLDNVVIRELVKNKERKNEILGSTFILKLSGSALLVLLSVAASLVLNPNDSTTTIFVLILALGRLFKSFDTIDYWFRSQVESQYSALARLIAVLLVSLLQVLLVVLNGPLLGLIIISSIHFTFDAIFYLYVYKMKVGSPLKWGYSKTVVKSLLSSSWPLILAGFATAIYMRVDQLIINSVLGETELGYYSSAVKISQAAYFLPTIISAAVYPAIINAKKKSQDLYNKRLMILYSSFFWGSVAFSLLVSVFSKPIILIAFGSEYLAASQALSIHIWAFVFVCLGFAGAKELLVEDKLLFLLFRTVVGASVSILANLFLISYLGIVGAAASAILSQGAANFLSLAFFHDTKSVFFKLLRALNPLSLTSLIK